jgi:hypothetical protein
LWYFQREAMFKSETNMAEPVVRWLRSLNLTVRSEFITPSGICDLVGVSFKARNVANRLRLGQTQPVGSITRAALLLRIPHADTAQSVTVRRLAKECAPTIPEEVVVEHTLRLIADGFVRRISRDRLQRLNGWVPLHKRIIAVELKLDRVEEAMSQAWNNLIFADESFVALPTEIAHRVAAKRDRWSSFLDSGVGLLAVSGRECKVLIPSRNRSVPPDAAIQFYCIEKFWRTYIKDS